MLLCEVLGAGSSAVVRALRVAGDAGDGVSWHVLACRSGASRQSRVLGARGASRRGGDGPPFSVTWTFLLESLYNRCVRNRVGTPCAQYSFLREGGRHVREAVIC